MYVKKVTIACGQGSSSFKLVSSQSRCSCAIVFFVQKNSADGTHSSCCHDETIPLYNFAAPLTTLAFSQELASSLCLAFIPRDKAQLFEIGSLGGTGKRSILMSHYKDHGFLPLRGRL